MTVRILSVLLMVTLFGCSGDNTDKETKTISAPAKVSPPKPPRKDSPTTQQLHPDLHISGTENNHISGVNAAADHMSES